MFLRSLRVSVWIIAAAAPCFVAAQAPSDSRPAEGLRDKTPAYFAIEHARLVTEPGHAIDDGLLVVRDGRVEYAGAHREPPAGAVRIDARDRVIYPGLIDAFTEESLTLPSGGAPYWNDLVQPQLRVADVYTVNEERDRTLRRQGVVARLVAPVGGILKGQSAVVSTSGRSNDETILRPNVALHGRLSVPFGRSRREYPNSPMGAVALARQAMYDAQWYRDAHGAHRADPTIPRPERNDALAALAAFPGGSGLVIIDAPNEQYFMRADRYAREFALRAIVRGSGEEYRRLDDIRDTGRRVLVPVNFPEPPNVATAEAARNASLSRLMEWDLAPENPRRLVEAGVAIAFTSYGLDGSDDFLEGVRKAVQRGLSPDEALRALTVNPAAWYSLSDSLGTLATGRSASFIITDGELFDDDTEILETWVDGERFEHDEHADTPDLAGTWKPDASSSSTSLNGWSLVLEGEPGGLSGKLRSDDDGVEPLELKNVGYRDGRLSFGFDAESFDRSGIAQVTLVRQDDDRLTGAVYWPDGESTAWNLARAATDDESSASDEESSDEPGDDEPGDDEPGDDEPGDNESGSDGNEDARTDEEDEDEPFDPSASYTVNYPLGAFGRDSLPEQAELVVFTNATVWTCGEAGILENASVVVSRGRIIAVGTDVATPAGAVVVDCTGKHITPGVIDCHSHMATDGGVNESGQAITAEVRIGDFIDANDINIYRQLAGGVTSSNILHGSANPIGGQNQVIKLRWGAPSEALKFEGAPEGIKFALGENVKQSNWGEEYRTRYPQTRMGVEQIMIDEFQAAREYADRWARWETDRSGLPPRRDLELDAIAEILEGDRWIHCHSYRQDEILGLIRVLDGFDVQIGTFQHILEGYKVAGEMAEHGAMGSAFSDWWAYKFEVYDAIPYAGALMHQAGVVVSYNSDDRELARHLNHEAAKAVKYGGVSPEEALKFVTLNPARQLRIDEWVGSLEEGKHADLVIWSGSPLSTLSRCEQTWIDGRRYFHIDENRELVAEAERRHRALVQKVLASGETMSSGGTRFRRGGDQSDLWPREDLFCRCRGVFQVLEQEMER